MTQSDQNDSERLAIIAAEVQAAADKLRKVEGPNSFLAGELEDLAERILHKAGDD